MITRQIGKLIRGSATPFQILAATLLGSLLAFLPGFKQAPGLLLCWLALLVILNANLFVAGIVGLVAKLVALLIAPVSFNVGRWLLEGPLRGFFETLVNAPVLAWFGFEYPLVTGGQVVALVFGTVAGVLIVRATHRTWRKLAALEKDSAAFQKWTGNRWVRFSSFVFVGGIKGKKSYDELLARRVGNPIRLLGVVMVVFLGVLLWVGAKFFDDTIVTAVVRGGLERANGATVDLENASLDPAAGALTLTGLAMCDPDNLATNLFAAKTIEAKLSTSDMLRKRATIDLVTVTAGTHGDQRAYPGRRLAPEPEEEGKWKLPDMESIGDILKNPEEWRERLATIRRWIERFTAGDEEEVPPGETGPSYEEVLEERIRLAGYANYVDDGLIEKSPTVLVRRIEAAEVRSVSLPEETLTIVAENISTQPQLVPEPPRFSVRSSSGNLAASLAVTPALGRQFSSQLEFLWKGLAVDPLVAQLKTESGTPPVSGGTVTIATTGTLGFVDSNLPLRITLHDTNFVLGGGTPRPVSQLELPVIAVRGPIDQPSLDIPRDALQKLAGNYVKQEAERRVKDEIKKVLPGEAQDLFDVLGGRKKQQDGAGAGKNAEPAP